MRDTTSRLASLDAFRGFTIAAMVLVNNPGDWGHLYSQLEHAKWNGWTFTDCIFPFFLFIGGVAMALSLGRLAAAGACCSNSPSAPR
jgi:predicted acyltransferase